MLKLFANLLWIRLPGSLQKKLSQAFSILFQSKISRLLILPQCLAYSLDAGYLSQFEPENGQSSYESYADFFRRRYKVAPQPKAQFSWPCEGYICDWGFFESKQVSVVKSQPLSPQDIFLSKNPIPPQHFFVNVFLHNHNYHRIHAPTTGRIKNITRQAGTLNFLRPWFYNRSQVSSPAFLNERVTLEFEDPFQKTWFLTFVGGFGVGSIKLNPEIEIGSAFESGQELGHFLLGSTICLASPYPIEIESYLEKVKVAQEMKFQSKARLNPDSLQASATVRPPRSRSLTLTEPDSSVRSSSESRLGFDFSKEQKPSQNSVSV